MEGSAFKAERISSYPLISSPLLRSVSSLDPLLVRSAVAVVQELLEASSMGFRHYPSFWPPNQVGFLHGFALKKFLKHLRKWPENSIVLERHP